MFNGRANGLHRSICCSKHGVPSSTYTWLRSSITSNRHIFRHQTQCRGLVRGQEWGCWWRFLTVSLQSPSIRRATSPFRSVIICCDMWALIWQSLGINDWDLSPLTSSNHCDQISTSQELIPRPAQDQGQGIPIKFTKTEEWWCLGLIGSQISFPSNTRIRHWDCALLYLASASSNKEALFHSVSRLGLPPLGIKIGARAASYLMNDPGLFSRWPIILCPEFNAPVSPG